jgi:hypothetical protein
VLLTANYTHLSHAMLSMLAGVDLSTVEGATELQLNTALSPNLNLQQLLLQELTAFKARYPARVGKHIRADAAETTLIEQLSLRFDLLR